MRFEKGFFFLFRLMRSYTAKIIFIVNDFNHQILVVKIINLILEMGENSFPVELLNITCRKYFIELNVIILHGIMHYNVLVKIAKRIQKSYSTGPND